MTGLLSYLVFFLAQASIFAVVCLGLNLQWGYTGLFNIGVAGFFLVGAYTFAILSGPEYLMHLGGFELPYLVGLAGALVASGVVAFVVGIPTLRLREDYLAIVTIGIATTLQLVALNAQGLTGGSQGAASIPRPLPELFDTVIGRNLLMLALVVVVMGLVYAGLEAMVRSPWGRVLKAIREDETAASSLFQIWTMLIVGGSGNNKGAVLGALVMWAVWTVSGSIAQQVLPASLQVKGGAAQVILIGLVLMVTLVFRPRGLIGEEAVVSSGAVVDSAALEPGKGA